MAGWGPGRAGLYYERDILGLDPGTFSPRMAPIPKFCFKNAWDAVIFGCKWLGFNGLHVPFCVGHAWDKVRHGQVRSSEYKKTKHSTGIKG